ncbi:hypothetical protein L1987_34403 [Smallanthus sonchifolius]|uniref:Uncharacterized protein n=1 Tax=Smallanthus sonchifolius TaxID=185202 RepID=A0ACB9HUX4_9ASTR|nr:hypothetical protein L1987_34403 [Smallanthus sonchifolius]
MSAGMAAKVQTKTYFLGTMMDLNNCSRNGMWAPYHDDRNQGYSSFLMSQPMNGHPGYPKEQMRLTILKQESIFRHQLQELHRLYKRQTDLMNELTMKEHYRITVPVGAANSGHFSSQISSQISKEMHTQRRVIDLELPADVDEDDEGRQPVKNGHNFSAKRVYNLADLNEPIRVEEASFAPSVINKNCDYSVTNSKFWYLQAEPKKAHEHLSRNRTVFGVELFESSHKPSFDPSQSSSWDQNTSSLNHNRWIEPCEKHEVFNGKKSYENLEKQLPHWLMKTKGKETTLYQMNLDSLQQHSQQFFKKAEKLQTDHFHGFTKILGVPVIGVQDSHNLTHDKNAENDVNKHTVESRQGIDLNLSFEEEEAPSSTPDIPETIVKTASMEIDLETPAALEAEPDDVFMDADDQELVKSAAEAIISISSSDPPPPKDTLLHWLAEVIACGDGLKDSVNVDKDEDCIPEGMDYFEYMTLKLQETEEEYHCYEEVIVAEQEEDSGLLRKRAKRKGQGKRSRQRKDFQRDVLPGIVSLSRREVTEDLQTFEEAFNDIGVSWQSKRKTGGKNGRGRRRLVVPSPPSPPPPSPPAEVVTVEKSVCREVALDEKSLSGWGKRTRRLPRQRCQNGSSHRSLALKC